MQTYPVYFWPRGTLASHLGSDTVFGAVCWAIRLLEQADVGELLANFDIHPRFAFSALSPVFRTMRNGTHSEVRFYPRPLLPAISPQQVEALAKATQRSRESVIEAKMRILENAKEIKQRAYLSESLFTDIITGKTTMADLLRRLKKSGLGADDVEAIGNALISHAERLQLQSVGKLRDIVREADVQHTHVDRVAGGTVEGLLFLEQEIYFRAGGGLWCVLRTDDAALENLIKPALRYLEDTGLGANRTTGKGHFRIEIGAPMQLPQASQPNCFVALSRYLPRPDEWSATDMPLHYELLNLWPKRENQFPSVVAGQRSAPVRKRRLRVFAPGSVFPLNSINVRPLYGQLAEVVPADQGPHSVWQSGITVPVAAHITTEEGAGP